MWNIRYAAATLVALVMMLVFAGRADAHQPYFEEEDLTTEMPFRVADPTVSTALYGTLATADDVDYVTFHGEAGQEIRFAMVIPAIDGQAGFNPTMIVMGPDLPALELPAGVDVAAGVGGVILRDEQADPPAFFEPFSHRRYWDRQATTVSLPTAGEYVVAVLHEAGATGRYTFVIGNREVPGGDPLFVPKLRAFWTPVGAAGDAQSLRDLPAGMTDDGRPPTLVEVMRYLLRRFWDALAAHLPRT